MVHLGLPDSLFWSLTPLLFGKLAEQVEQRERAENLRAGFIGAQIHNVAQAFAGVKEPKMLTAYDFFADKVEETREQSDEEMLQAMKVWVTRTKGLCH